MLLEGKGAWKRMHEALDSAKTLVGTSSFTSVGGRLLSGAALAFHRPLSDLCFGLLAAAHLWLLSPHHS